MFPSYPTLVDYHRGRDKGAYYHEYFLRGRPLLAQKIARTKVKGKGARKASSPETEPRLYEFPWMPETAKADVTYSGPSTSAVVADPGQQPMMAIAAAAGAVARTAATARGLMRKYVRTYRARSISCLYILY